MSGCSQRASNKHRVQVNSRSLTAISSEAEYVMPVESFISSQHVVKIFEV